MDLIPSCLRRSFHQNNSETAKPFHRNTTETHLTDWMLKDRTRKYDEKTMVKGFGNREYELLKQPKQFQDEELELDEVKRELLRIKRHNQSLQEKLNLSTQKAKEDARDWEEKDQTYQKESSMILGRKEHYKKKAYKAENERNMAIKENQEMSTLLRARSAELAAAEAFLSQVDPLSEQEVLQLVQSLNSEIMQIAASLAEDIDETGGKVDQEIIRKVEGICGPKLAAELPRHDPELTEIAIKTAVVYFTEIVCKGWLGNTAGDCNVLDGIYKRICDSQEQQVAGKWRALTRTHLDHDDSEKKTVVNHMVHSLAYIMLCAGQPWNYQKAKESILKRVSDRLETLVDLVFQLNQVFGIKITSADFSVFLGNEGDQFKRNTMDPYYVEDNTSKDISSCIIGTVELGLVRRKRVGGETKEKILLKAKVVLDHDLTALTE